MRRYLFMISIFITQTATRKIVFGSAPYEPLDKALNETAKSLGTSPFGEVGEQLADVGKSVKKAVDEMVDAVDKIKSAFTALSNHLGLQLVNKTCSLTARAAKDCGGDDYEFVPGGFTLASGLLSDSSKFLSKHDFSNVAECKEACDANIFQCKAFFFNTCDKGTEPRCLLLKVDKPDTTEPFNYYSFCKRGSSSTCSSKGPTRVCDPGSPKQYRCYAYNDVSTKNWHHRYMWNNRMRIPLFSIAKFDLKHGDYKRKSGFSTDDNAKPKRDFKFCGGDVAQAMADRKIPTQAEYLKSDQDRGHLLASEMILKYFPRQESVVKSTSMFMSNIWPQDPECNQHGLWRDEERKILAAAEDCVQYNTATNKLQEFYLFHGLMPSLTEPFGTKKDIHWVEQSFINYCCLTTTQPPQLVGTAEATIISNPPILSNTDCYQVQTTATLAYQEYTKFLNTMKLTNEFNLYNNGVIPFKMHIFPHGGGSCINNFEDNYAFPDGDLYNG